MKYKDKQIKSVPEFLRALAKHQSENLPIWFRGQARKSWHLQPSLLRTSSGLVAEMAIVKRFKQNAYSMLPDRPQSEWEWLFVMQHHGAPTRLLDWTENPLAGLYFAVDSRENAPGALWALLPTELNRMSYRDPGLPLNIPGFGDDQFLDLYTPTHLAAETTTRLKPVAAIAPRNTARMQAQLGVFTISHRDATPLDKINDGKHVWRYIIDKASKPRIRRELEHLHVTRLSLFPELPSVGESAKEILE